MLDLRKWLYKDANVFLKRKKEKFDKVHLKESCGSSKYKGVHKTKIGKWIAQINFNKKCCHIGTYDEVQAALAYNGALVKFGKSLSYRNIVREV